MNTYKHIKNLKNIDVKNPSLYIGEDFLQLFSSGDSRLVFDFCKVSDLIYWSRDLKSLAKFAGLFKSMDINLICGDVSLIQLEHIVHVLYRYDKTIEVNIHSESNIDLDYLNAFTALIDLGVTPPNHLTPPDFHKFLGDWMGGLDLEIESFDVSVLESLGMNLLVAVSGGLGSQGRLLRVRHRNHKNPKIAMIGKAVTFDSGGMNLKRDKLFDMKFDMLGGAYAACLYKYLQQKNKNSIELWIPIVDNVIGDDSIKPGSVIRSYNGINVEVLNTDAEGRLIIADVMGYACANSKPKVIIDISTLTASARDFFANILCPYFSTNQVLSNVVRSFGRDKFVELPLDDRYLRLSGSRVADIPNISSARSDFMFSGVFLKKFITGPEWLHFDIAGVSFDNGLATGFGFYELTRIIENIHDNY